MSRNHSEMANKLRYARPMDAQPMLGRIAEALSEAKLDAVMIGNAAAALHGAPVTTLDVDFFFRDTAANRRKLVAFAKSLHAVVLRPYYPVSSLFRVTDDELMLQADFLSTIHGLRSYEGVRARSLRVELGGHSLRVASLRDIVKSKRAAARPKDLPSCPSSNALSMPKNLRNENDRARESQLAALRALADRELDDQIARLLAKPMHERTHFLRRRLPGGGSAL